MFLLLSSTHCSLQDSRARINNSMDNATEPFPGQTVVERALGVVHGEERQVVYKCVQIFFSKKKQKIYFTIMLHWYEYGHQCPSFFSLTGVHRLQCCDKQLWTFCSLVSAWLEYQLPGDSSFNILLWLWLAAYVILFGSENGGEIENHMKNWNWQGGKEDRAVDEAGTGRRSCHSPQV